MFRAPLSYHPGQMVDENERRRALATLHKVYEDLARRAVDTVLENEEGLRAGPYSFAYQELEDRFAPRLINLGHMIGAIQNLQRQRPPQTEYHVERIQGSLEELETKVNERLKKAAGETLHQVELAQGDDGAWHAYLVLSRQV